MNILPKKRWHVRTKENIARVRRDEAKAAEEEKERLRRVALAEQEFRTSLLRKRVAERRGDAAGPPPGGEAVTPASGDGGASCVSLTTASGHINFFQELERGERTGGENEERTKELKEEREKYEKSIGYLTYLGQGSREESKQKAWFESLPVDRAKDRRENTGAEEIKKRAKDFEDPLKVVHRLVGDAKSPSEASQTLSLQRAGNVPSRSSISTKIGTEDKHRASEKERKRRARSACSSDESSGGSGSERRRRSSSSRRKRHKVDRERKSGKKAKKKRRSRSKGDKHGRKSSKKSRRSSPSPSDGSSSAEDSEDAEAAEVRRIQLERLRAERLQREKAERERAERLLRQHRGEEPRERRHSPPAVQPKYNNQFNPHLAKQNYRHK